MHDSDMGTGTRVRLGMMHACKYETVFVHR